MAGNSNTVAPSEDIPREIRSALLEYADSKNENTEQYTYTSLPSDKKRIRLLRLYPGVLKSPQVMCEMFEAEFVGGQTLPRVVGFDGQVTKREIEYEALSWRWGDEDNSHFTIMIRRDDGKMYKKRVSETLGLALKYIRRTEDRILWIDAICINQKDKEERSYQVSMMSLVYTRALQVCVWLGEDDDNSRKAFKFIREEISHLKEFDQLCNDQKNAHKWRAFLGLMQREWFSRRWVVQEIALAPKACVYCGPDELEWRELAIAVELFVEVETVTHRLSELLRNDAKSNVAPNWFEHISELGASLLVNATARIFREYQRADQIFGAQRVTNHIVKAHQKADQLLRQPARRSLLSLEYLVTSLSIFDCGRPHDSVYALIAIARDASPNPPTSVKQKRRQALIAQVFGDQLEQKPYVLDYNSPYPDVCKEFVQFCIERCAKRDPLQALDVLCRPWAKDWRPGDSNVDKDQRVAAKKEGIVKERKEGDWKISASKHSRDLFANTGNNRFLKEISRPLLAHDTVAGASDPEAVNLTPSASANSGSITNNDGLAQLPLQQKLNPQDSQVTLVPDNLYAMANQDSALRENTVRREPTHIDNRTMEAYRDQEGIAVKDLVSDFILHAFPKGKKEPTPSTAKARYFLQHQGQEDEDQWKEAREVINQLIDDPKLEDILHAKAELAKVDEAIADGAKAEGTYRRSPTIQPHMIKHERPRHAKIKELGLPSWVANIDGAPFDIFPHAGMDMVKMGRRNADPLVGTPQDGHRNYSAGQSKVVDLSTLQFRRRAQLGHYSLYLKGFCFDRVAKVSQVSQAGAIPASWLDLAGWTEARRPTGMNGNLDDPPTAFWRTLVADRGRNDRNPPYYYARACRETILKGGIRSNAVDTTALIFHERNSIIAEFCRRVQSVIWNRALIQTKKGALGLVSEEVREGDLICIIYGCTVPVILRQENGRFFKTENEQRNERLEDGIETMKRLIAQMERYRDRALQYKGLKEEERAEVKKHMTDYNTKHAVKENVEEKEKQKKTLEGLERQRKEALGQKDTESDIDSEDELSDIEEEEKRAEQDSHNPQQQQTQEQKDEIERRKAERKAKEEATIARHKERQRKAKVRDPLRHYRFLDQAYIHGMMDGEAVRQKFYTGKPDHIFEIR